jgi:hypothetical protein
MDAVPLTSDVAPELVLEAEPPFDPELSELPELELQPVRKTRTDKPAMTSIPHQQPLRILRNGMFMEGLPCCRFTENGDRNA